MVSLDQPVYQDHKDPLDLPDYLVRLGLRVSEGHQDKRVKKDNLV